MCIAVKLCLEHQHKEWRRGCSSKLWLWHIQFVGLETTECKGALQPFSRAGPRLGGLVALEIRISPAQRRTCFLKPFIYCCMIVSDHVHWVRSWPMPCTSSSFSILSSRWIRLSAISKHSGPLSAVTSPIQHLHLKAPFSHLVKDVEYKTISIQSSAAARSWKANLNLKSQISKQWCLKIFIMESYVVTFSFSCICKVGNHQLIIIDVMLGIWFNN